MSVEIYSGVAYGFILRGNRDEIEEEIEKSGFDFEAIRINAEDSVLVGVSLGTGFQSQGDILTDFEPIDEGVGRALEDLRSEMNVYSEIKFVFYFFYA